MTAWDELMGALDHWSTVPGAVPVDAESSLVPLVEQAMQDRAIDRELDAPDVARWLIGLALGHRALRERDPDADPERDAADLRRITTRWLHPARPRA